MSLESQKHLTFLQLKIYRKDEGRLITFPFFVMKILRIDHQHYFPEEIFDSLEELRLWLCTYHWSDWAGVDDNDNDIDIFTLTLDEICDYGEWEYKIID